MKSRGTSGYEARRGVEMMKQRVARREILYQLQSLGKTWENPLNLDAHRIFSWGGHGQFWMNSSEITVVFVTEMMVKGEGESSPNGRKFQRCSEK